MSLRALVREILLFVTQTWEAKNKSADYLEVLDEDEMEQAKEMELAKELALQDDDDMPELAYPTDSGKGTFSFSIACSAITCPRRGYGL